MSDRGFDLSAWAARGRFLGSFALSGCLFLTSGFDAPARAADPSGSPASTPVVSPAQKAQPKGASFSFRPLPDSAIPNNQFGDMVRLGEKIFYDTQHNAPGYVGNALQCSNCHIDRGRLASSAPLWAAYVSYPAYRAKDGRVNTFEERMQGCFQFSMNGKAPPLGDKVLVALESYSYFLAKGVPTGGEPKHGYVQLPKPTQPLDYNRGRQVYAEHCALCHGVDGQGRSSSDGQTVFPPLWGARSYNWGAGMSDINSAAAFVKANMPFSQGGTLSDADSWLVAAYVDSHERPQDPRFTQSVEKTRKLFHNTAMSMYGKTVDGVLLGQDSPPFGPQ